MEGCLTRRILGRETALRIAIQCPTEDPATTDFLELGAVTQKSLTQDGNTIESNDSSCASGYTEVQISTSSLSLSVSGNYLRAGLAGANEIPISDLQKYYNNSVRTDLSRNPIVLVQLAAPDVTFTAYMLISSISIDYADAENASYSMEFMNAPSPTYPPTFVDTPE